jgi:sugar lactone lactonase YvrE
MSTFMKGGIMARVDRSGRRVAWALSAAAALFLLGCSGSATAPEGLQTARLFAVMPACAPTPDGMAVDPQGDLIVACPNYADPSQPACLLRIGKDRKVAKWVDVPVHPKTKLACPMGIDFGPDGDVYLCDNQGWKGSPEGQFQGRILRLRIRDNAVVKTTVVAEGMEHPNGVRVRNGALYVTQSLLTKVKDPSGLLVSAVYRFGLDDVSAKVSNTLDDKQIVTTFLTQNPKCQYGADGIVFDRRGNLFVGNFGDGAIHKITFDAAGRTTGNTILARTDHDYALDPKAPDFLAKATQAKMRTTDGICVDADDNIYVADFSNNAVAKVTPAGAISVVSQNGECCGRDGLLNEPGEPIVWNGVLVVSNFDAVFGPDHRDKVNTKHEMPATLSELRLR